MHILTAMPCSLDIKALQEAQLLDAGPQSAHLLSDVALAMIS